MRGRDLSIGVGMTKHLKRGHYIAHVFCVWSSRLKKMMVFAQYLTGV